jgi:large subunit ribosomal protein L4
MKLKVLNIQGAETGKEVELPKDIFSIEPNDHAIYLDVKQILANQRQGTHKTKDKSEVTASTKKLKRQKGTGTARAGSAKSGVMVGGGNMHGPRPRDYSFKLNKKVKRLARASALSHKLKENGIIVIDDIQFDKPSTKSFLQVLSNLKIDNRSLFVLAANDNNVYLSGRNLPRTCILKATDVNTYEIMKAKNLVLTEGSLELLKQILN